jgi:AcrR family transcriptional regulator
MCKSEAEGEGEMRPLVASPRWTREDEKLLLALALSGTSVAGIAKRLHRSRAAVYHRAGKLKIVLAKSRRWKAKGE